MSSLSLSYLKKLISAPPAVPPRVEPLQEYAVAGSAEDRQRGEQLIEEGRVGCVLLAGGLGNRLGHDGPKGTFEIAGRSLFEWQMQKAKGRPLAIMTSPSNHAATIAFFQAHAYFGAARVDFFTQEELPMLDERGSPLDKSGPMGNGDLFRHFFEAGITWEGVAYFNVVFVDNPINDPYDPELIGHLATTEADLIVKAVHRETVGEKTGLLAASEGRVRVVEFIDRTPEMADIERYGLQAISLAVTRPFAERAARAELPLHAVYRDGYKFERFLFDLLPLAQKVAVLVYPREACFAPLKSPVDVDFVSQTLLRLDAC